MRSIWRTLRAVDRDIVLASAAVWLFGLSYGAIAVTDGLPVWLPVLASLLVIAGSSELLFAGVVAAGGNPIAAALAGLLVNARHLPYGLALPEGVLGRGWRRILGTHLMNDEAVVFALAADSRTRAAERYWQCGVGMLLSWPSGAIGGALAGSFIHDTNSFGLDAVFPAVILALIFPRLREPGVRRTALAGAAIALLAAPFLPAGVPVLLALAAVPVLGA
jgi:branched chain amino acid efflux pump